MIIHDDFAHQHFSTFDGDKKTKKTTGITSKVLLNFQNLGGNDALVGTVRMNYLHILCFTLYTVGA